MKFFWLAFVPVLLAVSAFFIALTIVLLVILFCRCTIAIVSRGVVMPIIVIDWCPNAAMQIPLFGGPTEFLATRGLGMLPIPGARVAKIGFELLNYVPFSADHHAVTTFQSPDAAACAHVDIMNSFRGQFLRATNVIDVVRIAAVDDRVARFQWLGKCRDGFFSRRTGWEHDPRARGALSFSTSSSSE